MWDKPEDLNIVDDESVFMGKANFFEDIVGFSEANLEGLTVTGTGSVQQVLEKAVLVTEPLTGESTIDLKKGSLIFYTTDATGSFTFNLRGDAATSIDSLLKPGKSITITMLCTMGGSAQVLPGTNGLKIDGVGQTIKWLNNTTPSAGTANAINVYTFVIIRNASSTDVSSRYTVLGSFVYFS